jgi:VanZ family protein
MVYVPIGNPKRIFLSLQKRMSFVRIFKYWSPVLLWMGCIFWMSTDTFSSQNTSLIIEPVVRFLVPSISPHMVNTIHAAIRKLGHVTEFFVLGILLFRAFRIGSMELRLWRCAFSSFLVIVLYAASDEFHQSFVFSRTASLLDVGIDTFAGLLAQGVSVLWYHRRRQ